MQLTVLDIPSAHALQSRWLGGPLPGTAALAALLRAELTPRGVVTRSTLLRNAQLRAGPCERLTTTDLGQVCEHMVATGDFLAMPAGKIAAAPLRCVDLGTGQGLILGGAPTSLLTHWLGIAPRSEGLRRTIPLSAAVANRLHTLGILLIPAEQWARLDAAPQAAESFLAGLDAKLLGRKLEHAAAALDNPDWRGWCRHQDAMAWRRRPASARLWRAATPWGGYLFAWTAGSSPDLESASLSRDEALRAQFALAAGCGVPAAIFVTPGPDGVSTLALPWWLPSPEYRWLSLYAVNTLKPGAGWQWSAPSEYCDHVVARLCAQLSLAKGAS